MKKGVEGLSRRNSKSEGASKSYSDEQGAKRVNSHPLPVINNLSSRTSAKDPLVQHPLGGFRKNLRADDWGLRAILPNEPIYLFQPLHPRAKSIKSTNEPILRKAYISISHLFKKI